MQGTSNFQANALVFPNPTSGLLTFRNTSSQTQVYQVSLTNLQGKTLFKVQWKLAGNEDRIMDLTGFPTGLYLLQVSNLTIGTSKLFKIFLK